MDKAWKDAYILIYYQDGELNTRVFNNNPEVARFIEELADEDYDFDPHVHAMVIKTEADNHSILTVDTKKETRVTIGGY